MKQGHAHSSGPASHKVEPKAQAVNVPTVAQKGIAVAFEKKELFKGRGYEAPKAGGEVHHCGSQGKH
jgi:hypothetical protein